MKVKLEKFAFMPTKAHESDAGFDLYAPCAFSVQRSYYNDFGSVFFGSATINTGVHIAIPQGYVGMIKSKSGLNVKYGLTAEGVIDSGYTGSIVVKLYNHSTDEYLFNKGEKIAQLVVMPISTEGLELVDELEDTERGDGGFGSSGRF